MIYWHQCTQYIRGDQTKLLMMHNWNSEAERLPSSCKLHLSYFEIIINKTENASFSMLQKYMKIRFQQAMPYDVVLRQKRQKDNMRLTSRAGKPFGLSLFQNLAFWQETFRHRNFGTIDISACVPYVSTGKVLVKPLQWLPYWFEQG